MKKVSTLVLLLFLAVPLFAQQPEVPNNIALETPEDYKATEALVLESIDWIQKTPVTENQSKRKEINAFIIKWITGTPSVSIALQPGLAPVDCGECLIAYLSGWTKYSLENNYSNNQLEGALAGAERAIAFYEKNKSVLGKNSDLDKMIKQQKKGKLKAYVESKL